MADPDRTAMQAVSDAEDSAADTATKAKTSTSGRLFARFGLASRAIVYGALTYLIVQLASGRRQDTDQGSALQTLGRSGAGTVVLVLLGVGVVAYTLWRWSVAWLGPDGDRSQHRRRLQAFLEGAAYVPFGYMGFALAAGDNEAGDQGPMYRTLSGRLVQHLPGQILVGAVGFVVIGVGAFLTSQGVRRSFLGDLDTDRMPTPVRLVVVTLGSVGSIARGIVYGLAGVLIVYAAITADPQRAGGVDSALQTVARQPYGVVLLLASAGGFAAFGAFAIGEAIYRRT